MIINNKTMELSDRLREARKHLGFSQTDFASQLGIKQGSYSDLERGRNKNISESIVLLLKLNFNLNPEWIHNGIGEMILPNLNNARSKEINNFMNVPLVPVRGKAGYLTGYGDMEFIESLPTIPVIVDRAYKGKYMCFEVDGDSMDDRSADALFDKDVVLGRDIKRELWTSKLHIKDWDFIIVHQDGITIKRITEHDPETGIIKCHSINPIYDDFELNLNQVYELYNLIKIVDRNRRR